MNDFQTNRMQYMYQKQQHEQEVRKSQDESRSNGHQSQSKLYNVGSKNVQDATGAIKSMA